MRRRIKIRRDLCRRACVLLALFDLAVSGEPGLNIVCGNIALACCHFCASLLLLELRMHLLRMLLLLQWHGHLSGHLRVMLSWRRQRLLESGRAPRRCAPRALGHANHRHIPDGALRVPSGTGSDAATLPEKHILRLEAGVLGRQVVVCGHALVNAPRVFCQEVLSSILSHHVRHRRGQHMAKVCGPSIPPSSGAAVVCFRGSRARGVRRDRARAGELVAVVFLAIAPLALALLEDPGIRRDAPQRHSVTSRSCGATHRQKCVLHHHCIVIQLAHPHERCPRKLTAEHV
mmetsp:Transcript_51765/g.150460  ORF Transcript_51765/g.150460 Transcript_51765/m.150460 type:complete len:289 (-) Transcript_51765:39-905(-)